MSHYYTRFLFFEGIPNTESLLWERKSTIVSRKILHISCKSKQNTEKLHNKSVVNICFLSDFGGPLCLNPKYYAQGKVKKIKDVCVYEVIFLQCFFFIKSTRNNVH